MNAYNFLAREPGTSLQSDAKERPFDLRELRYFHSVALAEISGVRRAS